MKWLALAALTIFTATPVLSSAETPQPYAGFERRTVKSLSDQQIGDLKAGRGMGLALAAELNGYPGPLHVLELAKSLGLSDDQRRRVRELHAAMTAEAVALGEKLLAQEADLERRFSGKTITEPDLMASLREIGATQAALRGTHLRYHLAMIEVLTPAQTARYAELRGYTGHGGGQGHSGHRH